MIITPLLWGIAAGLTVTILGAVFYARDDDPLYPSTREAIVAGLKGTGIGVVILLLLLLFV